MNNPHTVAGVVITVVSALLYNVGFVLEKRALYGMPTVHARRIGGMIRALVGSPLWLVGFACLLVGLGFQVLALSLVPISVVQPIFVSGIVVLLLLSHLSLGERLTRTEWAGVAVVAVSLLFVSLSLDAHSDAAGTSGTLAGILIAAVPTVAAGLWVFRLADHLHTDDGARAHLRAPLFGLAAGLVYGVASLATKAVSAQVERQGLWHSIPHVLASPYLYILGVASAGGLVLFQTGLQRCSASVVVPVSNVISSTYVVAVGSFLFGERLPAADWRLVLRLVGFGGVLVGMALLAGARTMSAAFADSASLLPDGVVALPEPPT
ncbi:MAG: DMT family transporter [Acidimicrobiales bacterium]